MAEEDKSEASGEEIYKDVLDNVREGVYITDRHKTITYWNKGAELITGYSRDEVLGSSCRFNILVHIDDHGKRLCDEGCPLTASLEKGEIVDAEAYLHHKEGHRLPVHLRTAPVYGASGDIVGACEVFSDISSKVTSANMIKELKRLAMLDPLTNLANRRYVEESLQKRLEAVKTSGMYVGVIFYDVDHFKNINDTYGHDLGDLVLKMVSNTLAKSARGPDLVGRWGGEEFVEIIPNVTEERLQTIAERNRMLIEASDLDLAEGDIRVTASLGATTINNEDTLHSLLKRADSLMYESKRAGRNCVTFG